MNDLSRADTHQWFLRVNTYSEFGTPIIEIVPTWSDGGTYASGGHCYAFEHKHPKLSALAYRGFLSEHPREKGVPEGLFTFCCIDLRPELIDMESIIKTMRKANKAMGNARDELGHKISHGQTVAAWAKAFGIPGVIKLDRYRDLTLHRNIANHIDYEIDDWLEKTKPVTLSA